MDPKMYAAVGAAVGLAVGIAGAIYLYFNLDFINNSDEEDHYDISWEFEWEEGPPEPLFNPDDDDECR